MTTNRNFFCYRYRRGWDFHEDVGLIMAGSIRPDARTVELTRDGGKTFEHLAVIPWGWVKDSYLIFSFFNQIENSEGLVQLLLLPKS